MARELEPERARELGQRSELAQVREPGPEQQSEQVQVREVGLKQWTERGLAWGLAWGLGQVREPAQARSGLGPTAARVKTGPAFRRLK